jgi:hypothetical protein
MTEGSRASDLHHAIKPTVTGFPEQTQLGSTVAGPEHGMRSHQAASGRLVQVLAQQGFFRRPLSEVKISLWNAYLTISTFMTGNLLLFLENYPPYGL